MSTNCVVCVKNERTGFDLLCDDCRAAESPALNREQIEILDHTVRRAAGGLYCGGSKDMDALVAMGFMASAGRVAWCPDEYFRITTNGRDALRKAVVK